jgi:hypothetical protein
MTVRPKNAGVRKATPWACPVVRLEAAKQATARAPIRAPFIYFDFMISPSGRSRALGFLCRVRAAARVLRGVKRIASMMKRTSRILRAAMRGEARPLLRVEPF